MNHVVSKDFILKVNSCDACMGLILYVLSEILPRTKKSLYVIVNTFKKNTSHMWVTLLCGSMDHVGHRCDSFSTLMCHACISQQAIITY